MPIPKCLPAALLAGAGLLAQTAGSPLGVWRGESVCATAAPSCHDEKVVYYIDAIPDKGDQVFVRADKIVDGKAITMGSGPWKYHRAEQTLTMETAQGDLAPPCPRQTDRRYAYGAGEHSIPAHDADPG
jgi:hypothetical protein